ncbi:LSU ribosomal protein L22P [Thermoanaerobacter thermohydrosulfuricus]|uniref:Large ribosomal subunit protein uL22 n=7 Tax=Thermoanaerobacter TaxID=1754 RepID=RL22_THEP3|nr:MULTISPECIES: 50S ribosomal protein L22 [Thermoanaerobacter]B0K5P8.1 RecName: Full=Large ribosomal subunit protein uL22; AltName: Full=50S ribosomal protein L22 [Thermoanaerobacter sp. X514]B0KCK5.1 RecName: Full=Large ribosomal subunit protein uL22; AltName: Full=50S ribosomal protein L22 [Thermoanaerobacter pseudethanolicus ATCC 33223]EGD51771.1 ribosomal protein L22 [Thermoanaerobacter ethanolicus JW 200]KUJ89796.1 MAG: 50S ribosomal protein L22 [Thermoanaerobacter thermocopriae]KUK35264
MEARAIARYVRISPRKVRLVLNLIRGKHVDEALTILRFTPKRASGIVAKVLKSAIANAENNHGMNRDNLYVAKAVADEGPTMKRVFPRAMGRADIMRKRTSHITIVVKEKE